MRELRAEGWRTRSVDHLSENWLNAATEPQDSPQDDTIVMLLLLIALFLRLGRSPTLWERDVSLAFRRLPLHPSTCAARSAEPSL